MIARLLASLIALAFGVVALIVALSVLNGLLS
jgi:ABC-type lipoprotein release transport system permease subunit